MRSGGWPDPELKEHFGAYSDRDPAEVERKNKVMMTKVAERFEAGSFNKSYYESVNEKGSGTTGTWK